MTATDPHGHGLDPAHILSVTHHAIGNARGSGARVVAVAAPGSVRVSLSSRRAAEGASAALIRVGYHVAQIGGTGRPDVLVTSWSAAGLEARLAAMRTVLQQLDASPTAAAAAVIEHVRRMPDRAHASPDAAALAEAGAKLRAWVSARSGIHAPHVSAIAPADLGNALRLRTAWTLETTIDRLIEQQVRTARQALSLFGSLRQHTSDDLAQQIAVRRAGLTVYPDASLAQDSSALIRRTAEPSGSYARLSLPELRGERPAGPGRQAASGFPQPITSVGASATSAVPVRPGGRSFPARRPGPRR